MTVEIIAQDAMFPLMSIAYVVPLWDAHQSGQLQFDNALTTILEEGDHAVQAQAGDVHTVHIHQLVADLKPKIYFISVHAVYSTCIHT